MDALYVMSHPANIIMMAPSRQQCIITRDSFLKDDRLHRKTSMRSKLASNVVMNDICFNIHAKITTRSTTLGFPGHSNKSSSYKIKIDYYFFLCENVIRLGKI